MKPLLPASLLLAAVVMTGCNKAPNQAATEQEIEKRVQERLADEHRAQQDQQLREREASVAQREQDLAGRESDVQARENAATNQAARAPQQTSVQRDTSYYADQDEAPTPAPRDDDRYSYDEFYDQLDPQGEWFETPTYGYVWRPTVAIRSSTWRPYMDGRWVYTDYGWTWVSGEPFGWATYHYGRWVRLADVGWVWIPGHEWAPAWVSWRTGDDYIGWAPLGPDVGYGGGEITADVASGYGASYYSFVSTDHFCDTSLAPYIVNQQNNVTIVNKTTNITKIVRNVNKKVVYNFGPDVAVVEQKTKQKVPKLQIQQENQAKPAQIEGGVIKVAAISIPEKGVAAPAKHPGHAKRLDQVKVQVDPGQRRSHVGQMRPQPTATASGTPSPAQISATPFVNPQQGQQFSGTAADGFHRERQQGMQPRRDFGPAGQGTASPRLGGSPLPSATPAMTQEDLIRREQERQRALQQGGGAFRQHADRSPGGIEAKPSQQPQQTPATDRNPFQREQFQQNRNQRNQEQSPGASQATPSSQPNFQQQQLEQQQREQARRIREEQQRQEALQRQQQQAQQEQLRQQQEEARRQQQEEARRQQQEEMRRQREEAQRAADRQKDDSQRENARKHPEPQASASPSDDDSTGGKHHRGQQNP